MLIRRPAADTDPERFVATTEGGEGPEGFEATPAGGGDWEEEAELGG